LVCGGLMSDAAGFGSGGAGAGSCARRMLAGR
jgi:hypothetical protein